MKTDIFKSSKLISLAAVLAAGLTVGCDNNQKSQETNTTSAQAAPSQKIEVVKNENAQEIKVAQKERDANDSKSYYYDYDIKTGYDLNAKPANDDASVRTAPKTALDANLNVRSPYEQVQVSMLTKKLSKNFIVKCSACHNDYGNGVIGPSLLGKDADYIFNKIIKFKDGTSKNVLMSGLIDRMDEKEIRELADEIFAFNKMIQEMRK